MPLRATLCGMANACPALLVLLWSRNVKDEVPLRGAAAVAQCCGAMLGIGMTHD